MKRLLYFFWPILFILCLWFVFASPYFLKNKIPFASNYQITFFPPWSAYPHNGIPVKNNAMPDVIGQIVPWKHLVVTIWKTGQIPLWNMYSFSGTPLLANYQSAVLSPFNLLFFIFPFVDGWSLLVLLQPLLAGFFTYVFARRIGMSKVGSLIASFSFMFCGFLVVWMGYGTLGYALLFLPLGMYAIESYFQKNQLRYLNLFSFILPLSFFSGHFQISLYVFLTLFAFLIYKSLAVRSLRKGFFVGLYLLFGILLCLPQLLPSLEFYRQSLRSAIFQRSEVIPWSYLSTFLAPDFLGNPVTRNDWFGHYAEWNGYIGGMGLLLALLGVGQWKKSIVPFLFIAGFLALLFALPTPLGDMIVTLHIPVLSTSAASRIICIYSFCFAMLAGFGWDRLTNSLEKKEWRTIIQWVLVGCILFGSLWIVVIGRLFMSPDKIVIAKQNLVLPSLLFAGALGGVGMSFVFPKKYRLLFLSLLFIALVGFDMYRFASKWQAFDPKEYFFASISVGQELETLSTYHRGLGNYGAEVANYYQLPMVEGYDALYPKRYGEFITSLGTGQLREPNRSTVEFPKNGTYAPQAVNLLDIKYIIAKLSDDNMVWAFPYWQYPSNQFVQIFQDSAYRILQNSNAYPRAFLVGKYTIQTNSQKILNTMFGKNFDLRSDVVLEQQLKTPISNDHSAKATIQNYQTNQIKLTTQANANMLLFLSDPFYPGWNASIDGKQVPILRADFAFRAIAVPAGNHLITFSYQPLSFYLGLWGSGIGLGALLVVGLGIYFFQNLRLLSLTFSLAKKNR